MLFVTAAQILVLLPQIMEAWPSRPPDERNTLQNAKNDTKPICGRFQYFHETSGECADCKTCHAGRGKPLQLNDDKLCFTDCEACPDNYFSLGNAHVCTRCTGCYDNMVVEQNCTKTQNRVCKCKEGHYLDNGDCLKCSENTLHKPECKTLVMTTFPQVKTTQKQSSKTTEQSEEMKTNEFTTYSANTSASVAGVASSGTNYKVLIPIVVCIAVACLIICIIIYKARKKLPCRKYSEVPDKDCEMESPGSSTESMEKGPIDETLNASTEDTNKDPPNRYLDEMKGNDVSSTDPLLPVNIQADKPPFRPISPKKPKKQKEDLISTTSENTGFDSDSGESSQNASNQLANNQLPARPAFTRSLSCPAATSKPIVTQPDSTQPRHLPSILQGMTSGTPERSTTTTKQGVSHGPEISNFRLHGPNSGPVEPGQTARVRHNAGRDSTRPQGRQERVILRANLHLENLHVVFDHSNEIDDNARNDRRASDPSLTQPVQATRSLVSLSKEECYPVPEHRIDTLKDNSLSDDAERTIRKELNS